MDYSIIDLILLLIAGAAGGFLSGLLGVGGGIIFIPILDAVFTRYGFPTDKIVTFILANSLFIIVFTGVLNSFKQYRIKNFYPKLILYTSLPGVVTSLFFAYLISQGNWYNKQVFSIFFVCIMLPFILRMIWVRKTEPVEELRHHPLKFNIIGFITGIFTAFSGLGGGIIMIPAFTDILKLDIKKATSVSAGVVPVFALPLSIYYMFIATPPEGIAIPHVGYVVYSVALPMVAGVFTTVALGVKTAHKLPSATVKTIFVSFALLVLVKMAIENILGWHLY